MTGKTSNSEQVVRKIKTKIKHFGEMEVGELIPVP